MSEFPLNHAALDPTEHSAGPTVNPAADQAADQATAPAAVPGYTAQIRQTDATLIVRFAGEISTPHYSEFRNDYNNLCRRIMASAAPEVILDLTQTTFFGSLFVGIMLKLSVRVRTAGGQLIICGLSEPLNQLLRQLLLLEKEVGEGQRLMHAATLDEAIDIIRPPHGSCAERPSAGTNARSPLSRVH